MTAYEWPGAKAALAMHLESVGLADMAVRVRALSEPNAELAVLDSIHSRSGLDVYVPGEEQQHAIDGWRRMFTHPRSPRWIEHVGPPNAGEFVAELAVAAIKDDEEREKAR